ncbi:MAG: ATP synthase F1 subunit delta [Planctomycetota bacterium]|nr:MAG: ATP synthase F1 subunit delta [Planctomycetota bacterium]
MADSTAQSTALDSDARQVGRLYARALLDVSGAEVDRVLEELQAIVDECLDRYPALEELLASPRVTSEQKEAMVDRVFGGRIAPVLLNFLKVLCRRRRVGYVRAIQTVAAELREEQLGRVRVTVQTPYPLTDAQRDQIQQAFRQAYGKDAVIDERVDESLLGGIVLRVGDEVIDGSVVGVLGAMDAAVREAVQRSIRDKIDALVSP